MPFGPRNSTHTVVNDRVTSAVQTAPDLWQRLSLDGNRCCSWNLLLDTAQKLALLL